MSIHNFLVPNNINPVYINGLIVQNNEHILGNLTVDGTINGNVTPGVIVPGSANQLLYTNNSGTAAIWENFSLNTIPKGTPGQLQYLASTPSDTIEWETLSTGSVTSVGVTPNNGITSSVANPTTTPVITLGLGAITPTSVVASGTVSGSNLSGTNTGDQIITLTSDVTGTGTGSFATTIANSAVTYAKMQNETASTLLGNPTGSSAAPSEITLGSNLSFTGSVLNADSQNTQLAFNVTSQGIGGGVTADLMSVTIPANSFTVARGQTLHYINYGTITNTVGAENCTLTCSFNGTVMSTFTFSYNGTGSYKIEGYLTSVSPSGGTITFAYINTLTVYSSSIPFSAPNVITSFGQTFAYTVANTAVLKTSNVGNGLDNFIVTYVLNAWKE